MPTTSKDIDEKLKLAHNVVDVVDRANGMVCELFARKKEDEMFQELDFVNHKFEEFIYLVDVMISVYDKVITNQTICNVLYKVISSVYSLSLFVFN